jgi:hypothetical protein
MIRQAGDNRTMTSLCSCLAALACAALCNAALAAPLQVQTSTMRLTPAQARDVPAEASGWTQGSIKMPYVSSASPEIARRINDVLYLELLGLPAPLASGSSFTPPDGVLPMGTSSVEFKATRNDGRVLTISVDVEGCGAYCESATQDFNFDAASGRALALDELFTPRGQLDLAQRMRKERERLYAAQVKELKKTLAGLRGHAKADDIEDSEQRLAFNESCLEEQKAQEARASAGEAPPVFDFTLPADHGVVITAGRCGNHAMRALDDVDNVSLTIAPADLGPLLTPYGKSVVLGDGGAATPASPFGQVLHGKIGAAPVTLRLERPNGDGSLSGSYYYDKYRRPIAISGMRKGAAVELTEGGDEGAPKLSLTVRGMAMSGQWEAKGKRVSVTLGW